MSREATQIHHAWSHRDEKVGCLQGYLTLRLPGLGQNPRLTERFRGSVGSDDLGTLCLSQSLDFSLQSNFSSQTKFTFHLVITPDSDF